MNVAAVARGAVRPREPRYGRFRRRPTGSTAVTTVTGSGHRTSHPRGGHHGSPPGRRRPLPCQSVTRASSAATLPVRQRGPARPAPAQACRTRVRIAAQPGSAHRQDRRRRRRRARRRPARRAAASAAICAAVRARLATTAGPSAAISAGSASARTRERAYAGSRCAGRPRPQAERGAGLAGVGPRTSSSGRRQTPAGTASRPAPRARAPGQRQQHGLGLVVTVCPSSTAAAPFRSAAEESAS
jgi:hypothetical protein